MTEYDLTETLPDGRLRYNVLSNGGVQDLADGAKIVKAPTSGQITKENASQMARKRWDSHFAAAVEGAAEGLKVQNSPADVTRAVFRKMGKLLNDATGARGGAEAARFIVEKGRLLPSDADLTINVFTPTERTFLLALLREEVIDAEITTESAPSLDE